ncbi:hypothetical protein AMECASPLE_027744 [Ameca splendens]|uniref:Uncharacterized protein n=1 Tax=Ameca splendens TaxID=208324 RepID=A0ABV0YGF5_9TELE
MTLLPGSNDLHVGNGGRTPAADGVSPRLLTHHEGGVPHGTGLPPLPALEPKLTSAFRNMLARHGGRQPVPFFPRDQIAARLTERFHQCATQAAAATSIFFLYYAILRRIQN